MNLRPKARTERRDRTQARAWALQIHYRWESGGREGTLDDALRETVTTRRVSVHRLPYIRRLLRAAHEHDAEIDERLVRSLDNWRLDRLSSIDRGILRLATAELLFLEDIPPKVSIQEAIRLAERYGGPESSRFVNGVLDALYRDMPGGA